MKSIKALQIIGVIFFIFLSACTSVATQETVSVEATPVVVTDVPLQSEALPMFRGSLDHTGIYDAPVVRELGGVQWKFKAEGAIATSVVLADDIAYFGDQTGNLYAVNKNSEKVWSFHTEKPINSTPSVANGIVYFQSNDGFTYALDAKSGELKWKVDTGPERPTDYDNISSSPAVQDGIVYIGGNNGKLYALNADTGAEVWTVDALGYNAVRSSPAIDGDTVYFTAESTLLALDRKTGAEKWRYKAITITRSSPSIGEGIVVFGDSGSNIYAVDSETGVEKWKNRITYYWVTSTATIANGMVYIGGDDSYLNALDATTGEMKWRFKTTGETVWSSPALVEDVLYVGDWNFSNITDENGSKLWGYMYAIDTKTGTELWRFKTGGNIVSSPFVDKDGVIYFGSLDGYLYALK
ncbi:MAG: PQQ-binding-like beta-propeller repeat protein [Anaerolineales bacterium]|nr:PQQ-binding-like beta-propeller repeat protein [Anaerolineales bacterium]